MWFDLHIETSFEFFTYKNIHREIREKDSPTTFFFYELCQAACAFKPLMAMQGYIIGYI